MGLLLRNARQCIVQTQKMVDHKLEVAHQQLLLGLAWRVPADGDGDDPRLLGRVLVVAGVLRPGVRLTVRPCNTTQLRSATRASN